MTFRPKVAAGVIAGVGLAAATYLTLPELVSQLSRPMPAAHAQSPAPVQAKETAEDLSSAFKSASRAVAASVVSISSTHIVKPGSSRGGNMPNPFGGPDGGGPGGGPGEDFLERFFGRPGIPREGLRQTGVGSGVVVRADGHILTNNHVVEDADEVEVTFSDGSKKTAKVVGTDSRTDLAVIKVDGSNLQAARIGDSDAMEVGDWVLALGNPFGLSASVTTGIVSAKGRSSVGIADYEDFIQTDAAINPGNSGGPLINLRGEVIGINTAIFSRSGGYMGIGFSIPSNMARQILDSILKEGRVVRGYLGVNIQNLNPGLSKSFSYTGEEGALVSQVVAGTPAEKAGLREGDIITAVDGAKVRNVTELRNRIAAIRPGGRVALEIFRDGKPQSVAFEVGELKGEAERTPAAAEEKMNLGMRLQSLTPELAQQLGQDRTLTGAVVVAVEAGSRADDAGVRARDIILSVQGTRVQDVDDVMTRLRELDTKAAIRLQVRRGDGNLYLIIQPAE